MSNNPFIRLWGKPLLLAALTIFGLVAALTGTGIWHLLSWIALTVPVGTMAWYLFRRSN
jgi:hypothetical protein